jgi:hypothetical protein
MKYYRGWYDLFQVTTCFGLSKHIQDGIDQCSSGLLAEFDGDSGARP